MINILSKKITSKKYVHEKWYNNCRDFIAKSNICHWTFCLLYALFVYFELETFRFIHFQSYLNSTGINGVIQIEAYSICKRLRMV